MSPAPPLTPEACPSAGAANYAAMDEAHKAAEVSSRTPEFMAREASKPFGWDPGHWVEWATVATMLQHTGLPAGARLLDVGSGSGWTSLFLAEAGFDVLGIDLVPANVELARGRAARWSSSARFAVADMERLAASTEVAGPFDAALIFDSLHHAHRQTDVLAGVGRLLAPGGWILIGEPTWLHRLSPAARRVRRELGWLERGIGLRALRRDLQAAGFGAPQRFWQGTRPYGAGRGLPAQLARLLAARVAVAPQHHLWLAAQRTI